jgi:divalent metal cation (Fe/Co/Zn/Cd) transporter
MVKPLSSAAVTRLLRYALLLGSFTIIYNLAEGVVSIAYGAHDESLALFGFGVDSFIECLSGLGIVAMILRIQRHPDTDRTAFERTALRTTGISFYLLAVGLFATAVFNIVTAHKPETTVAGLVISLISIVVMTVLVALKTQVGRALNSEPILADAGCTRVCVYMSLVLLGASLIYQFTGIGYIDSLGALGLIYFGVQEGRESLEKARGLSQLEPDSIGTL